RHAALWRLLHVRFIARINRNLRGDRLLGRATHTRDRYSPRAGRANERCAAYDHHARHDTRSHRSRLRVGWSICGHARDEALDVEDAATGQRLAPVRQQGFREGPAGGKQVLGSYSLREMTIPVAVSTDLRKDAEGKPLELWRVGSGIGWTLA